MFCTFSQVFIDRVKRMTGTYIMMKISWFCMNLDESIRHHLRSRGAGGGEALTS